jgi:hypothetical protein
VSAQVLAAWMLFAGAVCFLAGSALNLWLIYHP